MTDGAGDMRGMRHHWFDDAAGPVVRPYAMTRGRTHSGTGHHRLDLIAQVIAEEPEPGPERGSDPGPDPEPEREREPGRDAPDGGDAPDGRDAPDGQGVRAASEED